MLCVFFLRLVVKCVDGAPIVFPSLC